MSAMIYYEELLYLFLYGCILLTVIAFIIASIASIVMLIRCIKKIKERKHE